uniref:Uncharacterized protein n=1 Tax=Arundo donax TaxID=35708 RepID=A0A0A9D8T2_ARUDO
MTASHLPLPAFDTNCLWVIDCRHGHVFLHGRENLLVVWDPIIGDRKVLYQPDIISSFYSAGVLCSALGCNHLDCHGGPFLVVLVGYDHKDEDVMLACLYSSRLIRGARQLQFTPTPILTSG